MKTILFLAATAAERPIWFEITQLILPAILVMPALWYLTRMVKRGRYMTERSIENMAAMEKKADRIIELLEEANKKK